MLLSSLCAPVLAVMLSCSSVSVLQPDGAPPARADLRTVAERSEYRATSTSEEVQEFLRILAGEDSIARVSSIGKSGEGKEIPLVVIADPPVATPEEAAKSGKAVVLCVGNIHAGEVDGKEALLALARNICADPKAHDALLKNVVLAIVPNFNPDGNDRMAKDTRPGQVGPEEGQGTRENAAGRDLNRDFVKLKTAEVRALVRFMNRWDPALVIDTHTTNGSHHRYTLTYGGPKNPAGDAGIVEFVNATLLPEVGARVKAKHGIETFFYGNFDREKTVWEDYPDEPRYGVPYVGLRNRMAVLTESYSYAPYKDRVKAQEAFIAECLGYVAENKARIREVLSKADQNSGPPSGADDRPIVVRSKQVAFDAPVRIQGWEEEIVDGRRRATQTPKEYEVSHVGKFIADGKVARPFAYVIPSEASRVIEVLQRHGVQVDELREAVEVDAEVYRLQNVQRAGREFQGVKTTSAEAAPRVEVRVLRPGMMIVRTGQKLGSLAGYLLEPASADGLLTWDAFGEGVSDGVDFPVLRLNEAVPLLTVGARALEEDRPPVRTITFDDLSGADAPNLSGSPAGGQEWLDDGVHYRQNREGKWRRVNASTGRSSVAIDPEAAAKALAALPTVGERGSRGLAGRARWNEDRSACFVTHENDLYYVTADGSSAARLTSTPAEEELPSFSPDGKFVSFVRDNDLWVVDVATQTERALTTGGSDLFRNGKADWVYFEEIFGRSWRVYWWSPDSARIAFMQVDSRAVPRYQIVNNAQWKQRVEDSPYPKPGEPNPRAKVFTVSVGGGTPSEVDLSAYEAENMLVTRVFWRPDSSGVIACITNRVQTWMDVLAAPAAGGAGKVLFRETTGAWVDESPTIVFLKKDGSFLFASERTGWKHLYRYDKGGKLLGPVTSGEWECRSVSRVDEDAGVIYFVGTKDNPIGENLYRVPLAGGEISCLTTEPGSHRVNVAPKGDLFIDSWSSATSPGRVAVRSLMDGSLVRMLDTNPVRDLEKYRLGEHSHVQITTPDGFAMEATLLKPPDFDPSRTYPVWFMTYAGPHAPTINDTWTSTGPARTWDQALANAGFLVFRADPRSASGKGAVSAWACYKQLGVQELKDIECAITWLTANPWADAKRVGMAGHSYGGYITAYAMTHSKLFAAGIAGAPVTDWREYDSIYTERYMLTPQENPEGYKAGSVVEAAKNLHGRLLLTHGMMDDNVHLQNNTRLIKALQDANKPFEMMLYPEARHGIGGRHYQQLQIDFILRTLGNPIAAPSGEARPAAPDPEQRPRGRGRRERN